MKSQSLVKKRNAAGSLLTALAKTIGKKMAEKPEPTVRPLKRRTKLTEQDKAILYVRVSDVNLKWIKSQAESQGVSLAMYLDSMIDELKK